MKKTIALILSCIFVLAAVAGCAQAAPATAQPETVRVAALKGPTGVGLAALIDDAEQGKTKQKYSFEIAGSPDDVVAQFISGETDIAAVPINLASTLYNKTDGDVRMVAVNTLGVLYVLENGDTIHSVADLAGKTIYATGQGSTPEYVLNYILEKNGIADSVTVEYFTDHSEIATKMAVDAVAIGMMPEPNASTVLAKNDKVRIALDLTEEWSAVSGGVQMVQGAFIVRRSFSEKYPDAVKTFVSEYDQSQQRVNQDVDAAAALVEAQGIIPSAAIAKAAIPRCNITCVTGDDMAAYAGGMLEVLFGANPKSVGGKLPGEDIYLK